MDELEQEQFYQADKAVIDAFLTWFTQTLPGMIDIGDKVYNSKLPAPIKLVFLGIISAYVKLYMQNIELLDELAMVIGAIEQDVKQEQKSEWFDRAMEGQEHDGDTRSDETA